MAEPIGITLALVSLGVSLYLGRNQIRREFRDFWPKQSILVLGPPEVGKTSFILYLQGKPIPETHQRTIGSKRRGRMVVPDTGKDERERFRSRKTIDVGGEHYEQWKAVYEDVNPHGVVFMVDTQSPKADENKAIREFTKIYQSYQTRHESQKVNLQKVLLLVNKRDIWGPPKGKITETLDGYRARFAGSFQTFERYGVPIQIDWASLTDDRHHEHLVSVLKRFARSINR